MSLKRQLFDAIDQNNLERVKFFLEKANVPVSTMNANEQTLAHISAKNNNVNMLKYFLEKDPSMLNKVDRFQSTVLHLAVVKGALEVVRYLVEVYNFDLSVMGGRDQDRTPLHMAVEFNQLSIVKYFVEEKGMDLNVPNAEQTQPPIFMAIKSRHWEVIEYMIEERHANLTILNSRKENILFPVVRQGLTSFLRYLLEQLKVDYDMKWRNIWGETVLHVAAGLNRLYIVRYLVDRRHVDINVRKGNDNKTALHCAALRNHFLVCKFLVSHGADPNLRDANGSTPLELAQEEDVVGFLLSVTRPPRNRRHVDTYSPVTLPSECSQRGNLLSDHRPSLEHADGNRSDASRSTIFHLHSFLWLAKFVVRGERRSENRVRHDSSPLSSLLSRTNSVAIDVIDGRWNFRS